MIAALAIHVRLERGLARMSRPDSDLEVLVRRQRKQTNTRGRDLSQPRPEADSVPVGIGPKFLKLCARVLYRQVDIEAFEESCLATSTKSLAASGRVG